MKISIGLAVAFTLAFTACGKHSDIAMVTIDLGIPTKKQREQFGFLDGFEQKSTLLPSCKQLNLFAVVRLNNDDNQMYTYPISATSEITGTSLTTSAQVLALFNALTLDEEVKMPVPKGALFDYGIFGYLTDPVDNFPSAPDGICDRYTGTSPITGIRPTFTAGGHRKALVNGDTLLNLKVFTLHSSPPNYTPGCENPADPDNQNQSCARKDFVKIGKIESASMEYIAIEYLKATNRAEKVVQFYSDISPSQNFILPHVFPMLVRYKKTSQPEESYVIQSPYSSVATTPTPTTPATIPFVAQEY